MAVAETGRVTVERDVVFGRGGDRELKCNVYMPPQEGTDRPSVLLVHGGGWVQGDRSQLHGYGILLGRIGYVCVATEYRLAPASKWPAQIQDVKAALRWMRANSGRLGIDPKKISVSGNSAGGHLSLMIAGTQNMAEFEGEGGNAGAGTEVAACIAFYPPARLYVDSDVQPLREELSFLFGRGYDIEKARAASPITYASASFPPTLLIHGNKDELVPSEASFEMYRALHAAGVGVELHMYDGAPHGFDAIPDFGRQCAAIMSLFLDRNVAHPHAVVPPVAAATAG
ncbi:MAG: alpha/beta hydrolase [Chloroflexota bacterium]|nr:alpha/beta hydrolase [Chloroflexota bacterium]